MIVQKSCDNAVAGKAVSVVQAQYGHIRHISRAMRLSDQHEIYASHRHSPQEALCNALARSSLAWAVLAGETPVMMFGAAPDASVLGRSGVVWMLGTDAIAPLGRRIARQAPCFLARMHRHYPFLHNYAHAENQAALAFLRFCGFTVEMEAKPYGLGNELFYHFWRNHV